MDPITKIVIALRFDKDEIADQGEVTHASRSMIEKVIGRNL